MTNLEWLRSEYERTGYLAIGCDVMRGNCCYENNCVIDTVNHYDVVMEILEKGYSECGEETLYLHEDEEQ